MNKVKLCKETAESQLEEFKDHWDFEDPKEIVSGGEENSLSELKDVLLSNIMMGRTVIAPDMKSITHTLREAVPGAQEGEPVESVTFEVTNYKQHTNREIKGAKTEDEAVAMLIQSLTGLSKFQYSELRGKDAAAMTAIFGHLSFI